jgi:predicted metal-dependent hydrolase
MLTSSNLLQKPREDQRNLKLQISNRMIDCQINRSSARKTIQLKLIAPDILQVKAPMRCTLAELENLIRTKSTWITAQAARLEALSASPLNTGITDGAHILYLGNTHVLNIAGSVTPYVEQGNGEINIGIPLDRTITAEQLLKKWYLQSAKQVFTEKTAYWAARLQVKPQRLALRDQKTRWGSCSSKGTISFNWRVIMAPPSVVDYLIVHELCHMLIPNHSAKYWELVQSLLPYYKEQRQWLHDNGKLLSRIL